MAENQEIDASARKQVDDLDLHKIWTDLKGIGAGNITMADVRKYKLFKGYDASGYFKKMDYDEDGEVTPAELAHFTFSARIGREPTDAELRYATKMIHVNLGVLDRIPVLARKWKFYDCDNSGAITVQEIEARIVRHYADLTEEQKATMVKEAASELMGDLDLNQDGTISKVEYLQNELTRFLHRKPGKEEIRLSLERMEEVISQSK